MSGFETVWGSDVEGRVYAIGEGDEEHVYYTCFSPNGEYLAAVFGNGMLRIIDPLTMMTIARLGPSGHYADLPCTCVKWFPHLADGCHRLVSVSSGGAVFLWSFDGNTLERIHIIDEGKNEVATVDVSPNGATFLTAGSDRIVRLYNASTGDLLESLTKGYDEKGSPRPTHTNRIFSVRYLTTTLAATAGWECPVQLWDLRTFRSNRQLVDVQCGTDCLEPIPNTSMLLVVSSRIDKQMQIYDWISGTEIEKVSATLTSELELKERVSIARVCGKTGHMWCASISPPALVVMAFGSGKIIGRLLLPKPALNVELGKEECVVCCQGGYIVVAKLLA